jgi:hypothetical protein
VVKQERSLPAWASEWTTHKFKDRFTLEFRNRQQRLLDWCLGNSSAMQYIQQGVRETVAVRVLKYTRLSRHGSVNTARA